MPDVASLVLEEADQQSRVVTLSKDVVTLGRAVTNDVVLSDPKISRAHVRLESGPDGYIVVDLGSANGTRLNGTLIQKATLVPGDVLVLGDTRLRLQPGPSRVEPDVTRIDSQADLEMTLAQPTVSMTLTDTSLPRLTIHTPGKTWETQITQDSLLIGRDSASDIVLDQPSVSRRHAVIERRGASLIIRDTGSANGTWLAGARITEHALAPGETLRIGSAQLVFKPGFQPDDLTIVDAPVSLARLPRRPLIVVPGLMGSQLWRGSERIWPHLRYLFTNPEYYRLADDNPLEARGLVNEVVVIPNVVKFEQYSRLGDFLVEALGYERGKDLMEFAYDWRQDVRQSARKLAQAVDEWAPGGPITVIAHSLGCLVSRYYTECLGGKRRVGRLILLGGPHSGVPKALSSLYLGPDGLFGLLGDKVQRLAATYPSSYQILPRYACAFDPDGQPIDLVADPSWMTEDQRRLAGLANDFWRELGNRSNVPAISIFGYGQRTITGLCLRRKPAGSAMRAEPMYEAQGDCAVPELSTVLNGSEIHPVQQQHGALFVDNDVKMRLKLELMGDSLR